MLIVLQTKSSDHSEKYLLFSLGSFLKNSSEAKASFNMAISAVLPVSMI